MLWRLLIYHTDEADMYHNSATPPLPACYGDTCEPHQTLNMLSRTAEYIDVYRYIDIDVYRWSPYQWFPYDGFISTIAISKVPKQYNIAS